MDIPWLLIAVLMAVAGYWTGRGVTACPTELDMLERLIKARADRYIGAVAKTKVEDEIKDAATKLATKRLADQGVTPAQ